MQKILITCLIFCGLFCALNAFGQEAVGNMADIKKKRGGTIPEVTRQAGPTGTASTIAKEATVNTQDILKLGDNTLASITFNDGGFVKMREGTRMEVLGMDEIFLMDGHLFINNKWQKRGGRKLTIKTKSVSAGTIGTKFYVYYCAATDSLMLAVFDGAILLESTDPSNYVEGTPREVHAGQAVTVTQNRVNDVSLSVFKHVKRHSNAWQKTIGPKPFPVWGMFVPAAAAAVGIAAGIIAVTADESPVDVSTTATGTIVVGIPPGN